MHHRKGWFTMCGIAGFSASPDECFDARALTKHLLLGIEPRGRHATGAAFFADGRADLQKAPVPARQFIDTLDMRPDVTTAILHTRFGTKGSERIDANNHPIDVRGLIGVHNGMIWNDDDLFERIGPDKRIAQVDSEAIFATLLHGGEKAPRALERLQGSAAVAWIEPNGDPHLLHAARVSMSPLVYGFTEAGSFVFASTKDALQTAVFLVGLDLVAGPYEMPEGTYVKVRHGQVVFKAHFEVEGRATTTLTAIERKALNLT